MSYIVTPQIYSNAPGCTVFRDEQMILAAMKKAAQNASPNALAVAERSLGFELKENVKPTTAHKWSAPFAGNKYAQGQSTPINLNFNFYPRRPGFADIMWQFAQSLGQPREVHHHHHHPVAQQPTRPKTKAEKDQEEEDRKKKKADNASMVGIGLFIGAVVASFYEGVKLREALSNNSTAKQWRSMTAIDQVQTWNSHLHVNQLHDLATRLKRMSQNDVNSYIFKLGLAVSGVVIGGALLLGGRTANESLINAGLYMGFAVVTVLAAKLGIYLANGTKKAQEAQENADVALALGSQLWAVTQQDRIHYYSSDGISAQWVQENRLWSPQTSFNTYPTTQTGHVVYPPFAPYASPPPYNPAYLAAQAQATSPSVSLAQSLFGSHSDI